MGKLRDIYLGAVRTIRLRLPDNVVEAEAENATLWCTPSAVVFLQRRNGLLQVFAMTPRFEAYDGPPLDFDTRSNAEAVANAALAALTSLPQTAIPARPDAMGTICRVPMRRGVDIAIMATLKRLELFHYDVRDSIRQLENGQIDPERWAVESYLIYLSLLVDQAQSAVAMLVNHGQDVGAMLQQRVLVEYAARAKYALQHPDYTLWHMTIGECEDRVKRMEAAGTEEAALEKARDERDKAIAQYPYLVDAAKQNNWKGLQFRTIFEEVGSAEQHVSLYRYPSMFIHADPIGRHVVFRSDGDGNLEGIVRLPDVELNSNLVDATAMLIEFCRAFIELLPPDDHDYEKRLNKLERENWIHMLRYPDDRPPEFLKHARREFGIEGLQ